MYQYTPNGSVRPHCCLNASNLKRSLTWLWEALYIRYFFLFFFVFKVWLPSPSSLLCFFFHRLLFSSSLYRLPDLVKWPFWVTTYHHCRLHLLLFLSRILLMIHYVVTSVQQPSDDTEWLLGFEHQTNSFCRILFGPRGPISCGNWHCHFYFSGLCGNKIHEEYFAVLLIIICVESIHVLFSTYVNPPYSW